MADSELLKKHGFEEEEEIELASARRGPKVTGKTGFPNPVHRYFITLESFNESIEESYYWLLNWAEYNQGYPKKDMVKITDVFTASEQSSFFGTAQQRLGLQQDKVSQFLATIGKMVKELFQLVREIRILDERLDYYKDSYKAGKGAESAEITLKGIWIDMVEQGSKNPASVYGMARELQFVTLPDLFFKIHPQRPEDVDPMVDKLEFNRKVKEVLKRKLRTYITWKVHTHKELQTRRDFTLRYFRQHYDIINMYLGWVKPYLRNIKRMHLADRTKSVDLINAFEGSMVELEFLTKKLPQKLKQDLEPQLNEHVYSVMIITLFYRTRPSMNYQQEYQKGPLHIGKVDIGLRGYAWTQDEIDRYLKIRDEENLELLEEVDESVKEAMSNLGDELRKYLAEAGETLKKKTEETKPVKRPSSLDPFTSVFKGFREIFGSFLGSKEEKEKRPNKWIVEKEKEVAKKEVRSNVWYLFKDYKKTHGMLTW